MLATGGFEKPIAYQTGYFVADEGTLTKSSRVTLPTGDSGGPECWEVIEVEVPEAITRHLKKIRKKEAGGRKASRYF